MTGGSADLDPSTKTALRDFGDFNPASKEGERIRRVPSVVVGGYAGRNLHFGVREHAMDAIAEKTMQLRVIATSEDSSKSWDLRCAIRENFIAYIQKSHPQSLPQLRTQLGGTNIGSPLRS